MQIVLNMKLISLYSCCVHLCVSLYSNTRECERVLKKNMLIVKSCCRMSEKYLCACLFNEASVVNKLVVSMLTMGNG